MLEKLSWVILPLPNVEELFDNATGDSSSDEALCDFLGLTNSSDVKGDFKELRKWFYNTSDKRKLFNILLKEFQTNPALYNEIIKNLKKLCRRNWTFRKLDEK